MATAAAEPATTEQIAEEWPYSFEIVDVTRTFVDERYQRPLTSFVDKIKANFDPALFNTIILSFRESGKHARGYAVVDGQTRAVAVDQLVSEGKLGIQLLNVPALVYYGLTPAQEASLFARLQKERRGIASFHRFRAALVAGEQEPKAIARIVKDTGYEIGIASGVQISAVAALEKVYRRSPELLERVLVALREAWQDRYMPNGEVIRGMGKFLADQPDVDDDRLARRLSVVTVSDLKRRASALREGMGHGGGSEKYMSGAIEAVYRRKIKGDE